ncbi:MAG: hypothetical protein FJY15_06350 [Bacteroidetes bacterium]|nr:hypothetical protein [Bacteroidota bacterium]
MNEFQELSSFKPDADILLATKTQLEKDVGIADFTFKEETYPNLPDMVAELQIFMADLQQKNPSALMRVVNRIDLSESQYRKVKSMPGEFTENLSKASVLRAFQKVVIRKQMGE